MKDLIQNLIQQYQQIRIQSDNVLTKERTMFFDQNWEPQSLQTRSNRDLRKQNYAYHYAYLSIVQNKHQWNTKVHVPKRYQFNELSDDYIFQAFQQFRTFVVNHDGDVVCDEWWPTFKLKREPKKPHKKVDFMDFKQLNHQLHTISKNWMNDQYPDNNSIIIRKRFGSMVQEVVNITPNKIAIAKYKIHSTEPALTQDELLTIHKYADQHHLKYN